MSTAVTDTDTRADDLDWSVSDFYAGRAHLTPRYTTYSLCGLPVHARFPNRPRQPAILCPECAIAFVGAIYPTA
jgi:hypothetical protein